jgi:hypothetical protein
MRLLLQLIRGWMGLAPAARHHHQHTHEKEQGQVPLQHEEGTEDDGFNSCSSHLDHTHKDADVEAHLPDTTTTTTSSSGSAVVPTLVQLRVAADQEGMLYGALFHQLLATRGVLLLGLYRPVQHQSAKFDCVLTNPPQVSVRVCVGGGGEL